MPLAQELTDEIKREIGQHFVVGFHGFTPSDDIKTLIREYHVGNVILMKRNIQSAAQTRQLVEDLQALAREAGQEQPMLIGIDQENGLVSAFSSPTAGATLPGAMALAATGSPDLAQRVGGASAAELKAVGINWVYSPVADVNTDSRNPVIGVRSFGDDPERVALFASAVARGTVAAGVAPTAKHFPGHGDTHVDSHLGLPRIAKTRAQLAMEELVPFRALVAAGIPSVMTGHMSLPLITGDDAPASLSRTVTTGILREEMGFAGVVVTDCLEMDAVAAGVGVPGGAVRALEAGADVVMICHTFALQLAAIVEVYAAVPDGRVGVTALRAGGARIAAMKAQFALGNDSAAPGGWEARFAGVHEESLRLSREAYPRSTTVVWNAGAIPLSRNWPVILLTPRVEAVNRAVDPGDGTLIGENGVRNTAGAAYLAFAAALEKRGAVRHFVFEEGREISEDLFDGAGGVIWVMRNADVKRWQLACLERLDLKAKKLPIILVSSCGPYDLVGKQAEYEDWTAYVATYEFTAVALETLAAVVHGETAGTGRVPVEI
ncbi:glycoside hydrolase family 3 protein [Hypholoma sublateritium FD-334 SS-4]|uniref:Glycoside hydrolase family 3 protein n=1 Tax=Hypholoma sublateritium (strain FD-334 SS-4) TaxID=945553 RepID=A0A0D2N2N8_HYPSF|nr:glycoside hydrolase family 3 protein [Hypholoma sublateritium FD-334 SS-4]